MSLTDTPSSSSITLPALDAGARDLESAKKSERETAGLNETSLIEKDIQKKDLGDVIWVTWDGEE